MTDMVERTHNRAFEETPDTFNGVGVDITTNPLFKAMVDSLMPSIMISDSSVSRPIIGVDSFGVRRNVPINEAMQCLPSGVGYSLEPCITITLYRSGNGNLVALVAVTDILALATNPSLVYLDNASQWIRSSFSHGSTDSMAEIPCSLIGNVKCPLHLISRDTFLGLYNEINGYEPLSKRKVRVMEDSPRSNGELIAA